MDLWIRSQNKKILQKVSLLHIPISQTGEDFGIYNIDVMLAHYKTKERALEVLDEIQELLMGRIHERHINKFDIYNGDNHKVYEMPEE